MTLQNDALIILSENLRLRPCQIREELRKIPSYKSRDERGIDVNLQGVLKKLFANGYVKIAVKKPHGYTVYAITKKGLREAKRLLSSERINRQPLTTIEVELPNILKPKIDRTGIQTESSLKILKTFDKIQPKGPVKVETSFWLEERNWTKSSQALNKFRKELEEKMTPEIRIFATSLIEEIKRANIVAKGARYQWEGFESGPLDMQKLVEQERAGLDFEVEILLHFNGTKVQTQINWNQELAKVEEHDKAAREAWAKFQAATIKSGPEQRNWLIDDILENIRTTSLSHLPSFLTLAMGTPLPELKKVTKNPWNIIDTPEKLKKVLIERFASKICFRLKRNTEDYPLIEVLPKQERETAMIEVNEIIEGMLNEGIIEIVPIYLLKPNREKANKVQWKAREGYPSPVPLPVTNKNSQI